VTVRGEGRGVNSQSLVQPKDFERLSLYLNGSESLATTIMRRLLVTVSRTCHRRRCPSKAGMGNAPGPPYLLHAGVEALGKTF
jgi:hypothetical protein